MSQKIVTPAGRIVWGNPLVARDKEKNGQKVVKDGVTVKEYSFGLAIPKGDFAAIGAAMQAEAAIACPQGTPPDFAFKCRDGDTATDSKGNPLRDKPGNAGCYVLALSTEFPPQIFKREGAAFKQITEGVKTGDFCRVEINMVGHGRAPGVTGSKPGLYLNCNMVEFLGYGEAISGQADPNSAFGAPVAALPAGASATPSVAASAPFPGGAPQASAPQAPAAPAASVAPNTSFPWGN